MSAERHRLPDHEFVDIPGGGFAMGGSVEPDHQPIHEVEISPFRLTRCPITNAQYAVFCDAAGHRLPAFWGEDRFRSGSSYPDHPVVGVSWNDAVAFCAWAGERLATEAEWEYAARGGLLGKAYPFGDDIDPSRANYADAEIGGTTPVGSYGPNGPNGFGLYDMCGNVVEWVADRYDPGYYARSLIVDPKGSDTGKHRVIRGGGWHSGPTCCRVDFRNALPANWIDMAVGFRVAAIAG